jgi:hypothetical protein
MGRKQLMEQSASSISESYDSIMERNSTSSTSTPFQAINSVSGSVTRLQKSLNETTPKCEYELYLVNQA